MLRGMGFVIDDDDDVVVVSLFLPFAILLSFFFFQLHFSTFFCSATKQNFQSQPAESLGAYYFYFSPRFFSNGFVYLFLKI